MLLTEFEPAQEDIIKDICDTQIQSLIRVSMSSDTVLNQISQENRSDSVSELLKDFSKLKTNPGILFALDCDCISLFRHQLFVHDERYDIKSHKQAKSELWRKLFLMETVLDYTPIMN